MPTQETQDQIEIAELTQSVDSARAANDPFKLSAGLRTLLDNRLIDLKAKDAVTLLKEGDRATASANVRTALDTLETRLKDGYNFLQGLPSYEISDADRLGVYTSYGWTSGLIGQFTDGRIEALANQALTATPSIAQSGASVFGRAVNVDYGATGDRECEPAAGDGRYRATGHRGSRRRAGTAAIGQRPRAVLLLLGERRH